MKWKESRLDSDNQYTKGRLTSVFCMVTLTIPVMAGVRQNESAPRAVKIKINSGVRLKEKEN